MSRPRPGPAGPTVAAALALVCAAAAAAEPTPAAKPSGPPPLPAMVQWHDTPSGAKYAEVVVGTGASPGEGQTVVVHFTGWLNDGTQVDESRGRGKPFGFQLGAGQVIRGWDEGVRGMRAGGTRRLVLPPALAYGPRGIPGRIPPDAILIFDIQLLRVIDK